MSTEDKKSELKKQLSEEAKKDQPDSNTLLALSDEIAKLDENVVRFSVDAGVINRLGRELVGRHETAVAELVKNAYDADALTVELRFEKCDRIGGSITIDDNGVGNSSSLFYYSIYKS
jgi:hypothetical protein